MLEIQPSAIRRALLSSPSTQSAAFPPLTMLVAIWAGACSLATAAPVPLEFSVEYGNQQVWSVINPSGTATGEVFSAAGTALTDGFSLEWSVLGEYDPMVHVSVRLTNLQTGNQEFRLIASPRMPAILPAATVQGFVEGMLIDGNGDGGSLAAFGAMPLYTALFDDVPVAILDSGPVAVATNGNSTIPRASFGNHGEFVNFGLYESASIVLAFSLSQGDSVALVAEFEFNPVPEPSGSTLAMIGMAGVLAAIPGVLRRKSPT